jgi:UPF0755 protein
LVFFWFGYWHWLSYQKFLTQPILFPENKHSITVKPGDNVTRLANHWLQQGWFGKTATDKLVKPKHYLRLLCHLRPELKQIKTGEFLLAKSETPISLLEKLVKGQVKQYPFTIIEGMNRYQVIKAIKANNKLNQDIELSDMLLAKQLALPAASIEGWLFPDTYYFTGQSSALELLKRATQTMQQVLEKEWKNRAPNLPYKNQYEALIMASIVEKETALDSEREKVAGVFVRRLDKGMRLQTDPTVIYGIGESFNGDITRNDLKTPTPYNTYVIKGLPPTPIAMPSERSIYAALNPASGSALYFVADGKGGHTFSDTLEQHNKAVQRYLKHYRNSSR